MGLTQGVVLGKLKARLESAEDGGRGTARLGSEAHIAAATCQAVVLAHHRASDNLDGRLHLLHHGADNSNLLEVLFAEVGPRGLRHLEKFAHHLTHAVEVAGAHFTLHDLHHRTEFKDTFVGLGIHLPHRGHERHICTGLLQQSGIGLGSARIGLQVFGVVELCGVQKHTHNNDIILTASTFHQREVTGVQRAHCRHQADALALLAQRGHKVAQFVYALNNLHCYIFYFNPLKIAAKVRKITHNS